MASHFQCVGFPFTPEERPGAELLGIVRKIFDEGEPRPAPEGWHAVRWRSDVGVEAWAAIVMDLEGGTANVQCLTPSFLGETRHRARILRTLPDAECPLCDYVHVDLLPGGPAGKGHPVLVEVKDPAYRRGMDLRGAEVVLQVNLLAQKVEVFADRADFAARRTEDLEAESFVPTGLMQQPPRPAARVTGEIRAPRVLENPLTGEEFLHARIRTFGGEFDFLTAKGDHPGGLAEGSVVLATCSLIGRVVEGLDGGTAGSRLEARGPGPEARGPGRGDGHDHDV